MSKFLSWIFTKTSSDQSLPDPNVLDISPLDNDSGSAAFDSGRDGGGMSSSREKFSDLADSTELLDNVLPSMIYRRCVSSPSSFQPGVTTYKPVGLATTHTVHKDVRHPPIEATLQDTSSGISGMAMNSKHRSTRGVVEEAWVNRNHHQACWVPNPGASEPKLEVVFEQECVVHEITTRARHPPTIMHVDEVDNVTRVIVDPEDDACQCVPEFELFTKQHENGPWQSVGVFKGVSEHLEESCHVVGHVDGWGLRAVALQFRPVGQPPAAGWAMRVGVYGHPVSEVVLPPVLAKSVSESHLPSQSDVPESSDTSALARAWSTPSKHLDATFQTVPSALTPIGCRRNSGPGSPGTGLTAQQRRRNAIRRNIAQIWNLQGDSRRGSGDSKNADEWSDGQ